VIGPTSARAIQATPAWRVRPSPKNSTCMRVLSGGALSTMRSFVHCGRSVNRTASPSTPDHSAVARWLVTHRPGSPAGPTADRSTHPMPD
jgi:hypothetical protein